MTEKHVTADLTWDADAQVLRLVKPEDYKADILRLKPQAGEVFVMRVERPEDARTYAQLKHYFGHVITPLSEWNGDFKEDWHIRLKAQFMPEGKFSLTHLNHEEMLAYTEQCEIYARTAHPEAFGLYEPRSGHATR